MPLPIFGKSAKNPADIVRSLKEALIILESKSASSQSEGAGMMCIRGIWGGYRKFRFIKAPVMLIDSL